MQILWSKQTAASTQNPWDTSRSTEAIRHIHRQTQPRSQPLLSSSLNPNTGRDVTLQCRQHASLWESTVLSDSKSKPEHNETKMSRPTRQEDWTLLVLSPLVCIIIGSNLTVVGQTFSLKIRLIAGPVVMRVCQIVGPVVVKVGGLLLVFITLFWLSWQALFRTSKTQIRLISVNLWIRLHNRLMKLAQTKLPTFSCAPFITSMFGFLQNLLVSKWYLLHMKMLLRITTQKVWKLTALSLVTSRSNWNN